MLERGKRIRLSGHARSKDVSDWAGLWMRVDGPKGEPLAFDNMQQRPIKGTGEFADYIQGRVNSLEDPFEFEWIRGATWPWDWKLVAVRNTALEISDYTPRGRALFSERRPQFRLRAVDLLRRGVAEKQRPQLFSLVIANNEIFLPVRAAKIDTGGQHAEVADKIHV